MDMHQYQHKTITVSKIFELLQIHVIKATSPLLHSSCCHIHPAGWANYSFHSNNSFYLKHLNDQGCPDPVLDPATFRCIPTPTHLHQMDEFPHQHVMQSCKGQLMV
ncbi:hypothetical protein ILYODFUR_026764 [Ilyodon furcidens]|uniref:Uncharacterized protein n=1 Tax=Ilyodon furcidens TaxID=33524 RepID=A0ABV0UVG1_9TELE